MTFSLRLAPAFALLLGLCGCTGDGGGDGGQARPQAPAAAPAVSPPRTPSLLPITLRAQAGKVAVDLHRGATTGRAGDARGEIAAARAQGWDRIVLSWRRAPGAALTDGWAWERIAGPVVEGDARRRRCWSSTAARSPAPGRASARPCSAADAC